MVLFSVPHGGERHLGRPSFHRGKVNCLGACALAPIAVLDGVYHYHMTPSKLRRLIRSVTKAEKENASDAAHHNPE
jgi:(2Fe-2S) ferredoxin